MRLKGKVCIVTGGGSGIGRATCLLFAREGARVVVTDKRAEAADAVAAECRARGAEAIAVAGDVSKDGDAKRMLDETVRAFGRLDVLVNNAGYGFAGTVVDTDEEAWDDLMAVNVRGVYLCSKHAIPAMAKNGGGAIVNTASVVAAVGIRNRAAYCASKGAVIALTRAVAVDHVADGVRVNAVCPGTVDTPWVRRLVEEVGESLEALRARQLMGRLGTSQEVASAVLYLASDDAAFVTGTAFVIDGGLSAA
jgi:meso-butanediol dehydrogenase / (S,S)-butanediol dehydrogenase / diacetyl reductase